MAEAKSHPLLSHALPGQKKKQDLEGQKAKAWMDCGWLENVHF